MLILVPYVLPEQNLGGKNPMYGINTSKAVIDRSKVSVRVCKQIRICMLWLRIPPPFQGVRMGRTNNSLFVYIPVQCRYDTNGRCREGKTGFFQRDECKPHILCIVKKASSWNAGNRFLSTARPKLY